MKLEINGATIQDCSTEQAIMIIKSLSEKPQLTYGLPRAKETVKKPFKKRIFGKHHFWTEDELVYLTENLDKPSSKLRRYYNNKFTVSAIGNMKWRIKNGKK